MNFVGAAKPLDAADIAAEATKLNCDIAAVWAVCDVESAASGFLLDHRPVILFESHYFHTLTRGIYDRSYPNISTASWDRSTYGASGAHQYDRMNVAIGLNQDAGLESASWGRFQIMGANFQACGYQDVMSYVQAMMADEENHLLAFGQFCNNSGITPYLRSHDWEHFALRYNGSGNVADYAGKLANAYARRVSQGFNKPPVTTTPGTPTPPTPTTITTLKQGMKGAAVMALQQDLIKLGYQITADGDFGPGTFAAVEAFQKKMGLFADGVVGPVTMTALHPAVAA